MINEFKSYLHEMYVKWISIEEDLNPDPINFGITLNVLYFENKIKITVLLTSFWYDHFTYTTPFEARRHSPLAQLHY